MLLNIKSNFEFIEFRFKIQTIASHGDFANRKLGITNHQISDDLELRHTLGIQCEAYDKRLMDSFDIYLSDRMPPQKFVPMEPKEAINKGHNIICILTHPRQWNSSWVDNTRENITRFVEGFQWSKNR